MQLHYRMTKRTKADANTVSKILGVYFKVEMYFRLLSCGTIFYALFNLSFSIGAALEKTQYTDGVFFSTTMEVYS